MNGTAHAERAGRATDPVAKAVTEGVKALAGIVEAMRESDRRRVDEWAELTRGVLSRALESIATQLPEVPWEHPPGASADFRAGFEEAVTKISAALRGKAEDYRNLNLGTSGETATSAN